MGTPKDHVSVFAIAVNVKTAGQHAVFEKHAELDWPFYHQLEVMFPPLNSLNRPNDATKWLEGLKRSVLQDKWFS